MKKTHLNITLLIPPPSNHFESWGTLLSYDFQFSSEQFVSIDIFFFSNRWPTPQRSKVYQFAQFWLEKTRAVSLLSSLKKLSAEYDIFLALLIAVLFPEQVAKKVAFVPVRPPPPLPPRRKVLPITACKGRLRPKGEETHEGREICHCGMWKDLKGLTASFYSREKDKKTFWFIDLFIFKRRLRKGHLCCQKWYVKGWGFGFGV